MFPENNEEGAFTVRIIPCFMSTPLYLFNTVFGLLKKHSDKEVNMVGHEQM